MEQKMRIQLFDEDFNQISDRLVTQGPEFTKGPKEVNKNPMKIEFSLFTEEDIGLCTQYLHQLTGQLPLDKPKGKRGRKKLNSSAPDYREDLVQYIGTELDPTQLIKHLRDEGFVFTTLDFLEDLGNPVAIARKHRKKYKWLVRLLRKAKNPLRNRYDLSVLIGFRGNKILVYSGEDVLLQHVMADDIATKIKIPVKFKVKFPVYMQTEERAQFRVQMELLRKDLELSPTRLYTRWLGEVVRASPLEIEFPRAGAITDIYEKDKTVQAIQNDLISKEKEMHD